MSRAVSRSCSNSGRLAAAAARRAMKLGPLRASAFCRPGLDSALLAFSLKVEEVAICIRQVHGGGWGRYRGDRPPAHDPGWGGGEERRRGQPNVWKKYWFTVAVWGRCRLFPWYRLGN